VEPHIAAGDAAADVVSDGYPDPARPGHPGRRRVGLIAAALAALCVLAAVGGDSWQRQRESEDLLHGMLEGQHAVVDVQSQVQSMAQYVGPTLGRADIDPALRSYLVGLLRSAAGRRLTALERAREDVADTQVLSWHDDTAAARDAYVAYLDATIAYFTLATADARVLYASPPETGSLFTTALQSFRQVAKGNQYDRLVAASRGF
jgi:hypothetical protein